MAISDSSFLRWATSYLDLATFLVLCATLVVVLVYTIETSRIRKNQIRPFLVLERPLIGGLALRNVGYGPAVNIGIRMRFDSDAAVLIEPTPDRATYIAREDSTSIELSYRRANAEIPYSEVRQLLPNPEQRVVHADISYSDLAGISYRDRFRLGPKVPGVIQLMKDP
jgi:hypothetical protein